MTLATSAKAVVNQGPERSLMKYHALFPALKAGTLSWYEKLPPKVSDPGDILDLSLITHLRAVARV